MKQSKATRGGHDAERVLPWIPGFEYAPNDTRFLGGPIDFIVFDGLENDELREVVFVEVKTGKATLSPRERQVRDAIAELKVRHEVVRVEPPTETQAARLTVKRSLRPIRVRELAQLPEELRDEGSDGPPSVVKP